MAQAPPPPSQRDDFSLSARLGQPGQGLPIAIQSTTHIGPLPLPDTLTAYGNVDPTFPERIMRMAEENASIERLTTRRSQTYLLVDTIISRTVALIFAGSA